MEFAFTEEQEMIRETLESAPDDVLGGLVVAFLLVDRREPEQTAQLIGLHLGELASQVLGLEEVFPLDRHLE